MSEVVVTRFCRYVGEVEMEVVQNSNDDPLQTTTTTKYVNKNNDDCIGAGKTMGGKNEEDIKKYCLFRYIVKGV